MNMTLKPAFGLSGSALKVIAMISMVIDHIALYLMEHGTVLYETMRCVGRIAFPVFAFLIAEGFIHTRSRYRYFFTLLGFAVISEIPWYLLNGADGTHNVMFTLALGVATLMVLENLLQRSMVLGFLWTLGMAGLASWLGVDYEWRGIIVIDRGRKINCVMRRFFPSSSVGDRPAPRGCTSTPDERKVTTI